MAQSLPISTIVNVQISLQARGVTQKGFGIPLILGVNGSFGGERSRVYQTIDQVLGDFNSADDEYKAAAAIFAQQPSLEQIKIGVEGSRVAQVITIVFSGNLITGNAITGKVNGEDIATVPFNTSNSQTLTDLATTLQALPEIVTAVSNGTNTVTVTAANAGVPIVVSDFEVNGGASQATAVITTTVDNHGVADDLAEISDIDDDWYALIWTERDKDQVVQAAKYIEAKKKIFCTCTDDTNALNPLSNNDVAYIIGNSNYNRSFVIYNATPSDFPDAAWVGARLPYDPGSATWKFTNLVGITPDQLTPAEVAALVTKHCNAYVTVAGNDMTLEGMMGSGLFIDLIIGIDWLQARMEERVFSRLVNLPKIPFTDAGIAQILAQVHAVLRLAVSKSVLADDPEPTATAPKATDVDPNDRANRLLPDVVFTGRMAGAIHKVIIQGTVTV